MICMWQESFIYFSLIKNVCQYNAILKAHFITNSCYILVIERFQKKKGCLLKLCKIQKIYSLSFIFRYFLLDFWSFKRTNWNNVFPLYLLKSCTNNYEIIFRMNSNIFINQAKKSEILQNRSTFYFIDLGANGF